MHSQRNIAPYFYVSVFSLKHKDKQTIPSEHFCCTSFTTEENGNSHGSYIFRNSLNAQKENIYLKVLLFVPNQNHLKGIFPSFVYAQVFGKKKNFISCFDSCTVSVGSKC